MTDTVLCVSTSDFGRSASTGREQEPTSPSPSAPSFRETVSAWRDDLAASIRGELAADPLSRIDLGSPHPGGLAQLYAEQTTRLSSLFRDPDQLAEIEERILNLLRSGAQMVDAHGAVTLYLAIGSASWDDHGQVRTVPVLLRPVEVELDASGEIIITVRPGIEISNRLLMVLSRHGNPLETGEVLELSRTKYGFAPERALELIRRYGGVVPGFNLDSNLTLGLFAHPKASLLRELGAPQWLSLSPLVRALAGSAEAVAELAFEAPEPNPHDRDPWAEKGIGPQSPQVADVIELACGPHSFLVEVPPGADLVGAVAAVAAEQAAAGQKVLIVSPHGAPQEEIHDALEKSGITGVANIVDGTLRSAEEVQENLQDALLDASDPYDRDHVDALRTRLRQRREELSSYTSSLHQDFPQWGVSALDALQVLTDLTSLPTGPRTRVRLSKASLELLAADQGEEARELLEKAAELGMFSGDIARNWWAGIVVEDTGQVEEVLASVRRVSEQLLPEAEKHMVRVSEETGLKLAGSVAEWEEELALLSGVQESLDVFTPQVFERSAADMAVATAPKEWRKDRGIKLSGSARRRLVKQAKDLLIPGAHAPDLHEQLTLVQSRRDQWRRFSDGSSWPALPRDLRSVVADQEELRAELAVLSPYLAPVYGDLSNLSIEELGGLIDALAGDPAGADELPERVAVGGRIEELGLSELLEDLRERGVEGDAIGPELDLAWWATLLSTMLVEDPRLGGFDPTQLQDALADLQKLEDHQASSLGPELRSQIIRRRQQALAADPSAYSVAEEKISTPMAASAYYARVPLSWDIMPVVITPPALVPEVVPWGRHVDVVILAGVDHTPLSALVPILARGTQVIVFGQQGKETPVFDELATVLPAAQLPPEPRPVNDAIVQLLAKYQVAAAGISIPDRHRRARLDLTLVDGRAMPAPGVHAIESSQEEVDQVVELVQAHAKDQPDTSLVVVGLNDRHAERIQAALAAEAPGDPDLDRFLRRISLEPFAVTGPEGAADLTRDRAIVSVGFAKTPHGRVIHDFGPYSQSGGEHLLAGVLRAGRRDLSLVAGFSPAEVDEERLRQPGARMLVDLLRLGESETGDDDLDWSTLEVAPDHLLVDLADRLYSLGLNVVPNLGVAGGIRIPLAIGHPEVPDELLVAVLTDDDAYVNEPSLRVRDRLIPKLLEEQGWKVRTELSMAVFIDPNKEAEAIVQLVLDAVDDFYQENPHLRPDLVEPSGEPASEILSAEDLGLDDPAGEADGSAELTAESSAQLMLDFAEIDDPVVGTAIRNQTVGKPAIAAGLPLSAYGDDQLDEVARWIISTSSDPTEEEVAEGIRDTLGLHRRGAQSDAVLRNVARRALAGEPEAELE